MPTYRKHRSGWIFTEITVSLAITAILFTGLVMAMNNFRQFNAYQLARQNCIAAAQAQLDSYSVLGQGLNQEDIKRLWPNVIIENQMQQGQGDWQGFTLIKVSARNGNTNKHRPIELSRYVRINLE